MRMMGDFHPRPFAEIDVAHALVGHDARDVAFLIRRRPG